VWLRALKNKDVRNVNSHLVMIFSDNGAPTILQSDNGPEFKDMAMTTKQLTTWVKKAGLRPITNVAAVSHLMSSKTCGVGMQLEDHFKSTFPNTHMVFGRVKASTTQGSVERANQDVQRFLFYTMLFHESQGKPRGVWYPYLFDVQRRMNHQKKKSRGGKSPHEIFFGRDPMISVTRFQHLSPSLQKELMGVWVDFTSEY
jgi:IS30 family transposase